MLLEYIQRLTDTKFEEISRALYTSDQRPEQKLDILILTTSPFVRVRSQISIIRGYNLHRKDRLGKKGGGILVYMLMEILKPYVELTLKLNILKSCGLKFIHINLSTLISCRCLSSFFNEQRV